MSRKKNKEKETQPFSGNLFAILADTDGETTPKNTKTKKKNKLKKNKNSEQDLWSLGTPTLKQQSNGSTIDTSLPTNQVTNSNENSFETPLLYSPKGNNSRKNSRTASPLTVMRSNSKSDMFVSIKLNSTPRSSQSPTPRSVLESPKRRTKSISDSLSNGTPKTPKTPSFSTISTSASLYSYLENSSLKWDIDFRTNVWKEWSIALKQSESSSSNKFIDENLQFWTFKQIFLMSKAFENIIMSVLVSLTSITTEEELILWEIFNDCTFGEESEKYQIFSQITNISELLKGKTKNSFDLIQGMISIVSKLKLSKMNDSNNEKIINSLTSLDNELIEIKKNPFSTLNLINIHKKKIELLKLSITKDEELYSDILFKETSKSLKERFKVMNDPNIQIFEQNEKEAKEIVEKYQEIIDNFDDQLEKFELEETSLLEKKDELEEQLKEINKKLLENRMKLEKLDSDKKETENQMEQTKTKFKYQSIQLSNSFQQSDYRAFKKIEEFISTTEEFLFNEIEKRNITLTSVLHQSSKQFLNQIEKHLENQNEILTELLKNIVSVTTELTDIYQRQLNEPLDLKDKSQVKTLFSQIEIYFQEIDIILIEAQEINNENILYRNKSEFVNLFNKNQFQLETMNNIQNTAYKCKENVQTMKENFNFKISDEIISQDEMFSVPIKNSKTNDLIKDSNGSTSSSITNQDFFTAPPQKKSKSFKKKKKKFSKNIDILTE
eukprot:gene3117-5287_t